MAKLLERLQKRKRYLMELSEIWVSEGIYGEGYYHGDLHAGNIMFDDNGLTVIDFGNATKLSSTQQEHVTRMMLAAAAGDMGMFRHGFHKLLENTPESIYQDKREALGRVFEEVFSLGNKSSAGYRVAVALLKAQELGIELPAAINNFSSGQIRLQNSIDSMNQQIRSVRNELMDLDTISYQIIAVDPVAKIYGNQHFKFPEEVKKEKVRLMKELRDSLVFARLDFIEKLKGSSRAEQKKESPDDALLDQMIDSFAAKYEKDFEHNCTRMGALEDSRVFLNDSSDYTKNAVATELQMWFDDKKNFGEALKKTFEEFRASKEKGEPAEVILQKEDAFIDIYRKAVIVHLNEMISECSKEVPSEPIEDFCDVMGSVIDSNLAATLSRLSFFKAFMLKRKIEA